MTYSDQLILSTSSQVSTIRTEAYTSDVQIPHRIDGLILKNADLLTSDNVKDLSRAVATSSNIFAIMTKAYTANNALVLKGVHKIDIKHTGDFRVENCEPVRVDLLLVVRKTLKIKLGKSITHSPKLLSRVTCRRMTDLW